MEKLRKVQGTLHATYSGDTLVAAVHTASDARVDVIALVEAWMLAHAGARVRKDIANGSFYLCVDPASPYALEVQHDPNPAPGFRSHVYTEKLADGSFGFSNTMHYFESWLQSANASCVQLELSDTHIHLVERPDPHAPVLQYCGDGNSPALDDAWATTICKPGTVDCCIWLMMAPGGWQCAKFGSSGRSLLQRHATGTMNATRVGSCRVRGRIPDDAPVQCNVYNPETVT